jgi:hypothetical protein
MRTRRNTEANVKSTTLVTRSSSLNQPGKSPHPADFENASKYWPEKTVFRANVLTAFTLG